jgi:DNA-binding PadR family transcriptional regulator
MVAVGSSIKRGSAELAVLAVLRDRPVHGYEIARRIEQQTGGVIRFTLASLYPLLYRMEKRGWIKGAWETTPSGRKRRCYRVTPAGQRRLPPLLAQWRLFFRALDRLAGASHA